MKNFLLFCGLLLSLFSASFAQADLTEQQRIADAEQLVNLFHHRYAPMSWKEKLWKIDRNDLANKLMEEAANAKNDIEFYEAMVNYLGALQDAHVSWDIPSTAQHGYDINFNYFGKSILVKEVFEPTKTDHPEISVGDILLTINGEPAEDELKKVLHYVRMGSELADKRQAARYLNWRPQETFPALPHNGEKILLGLRSAKTNQKYFVELAWEHWAGFDLSEATRPDILLSSLNKTFATRTASSLNSSEEDSALQNLDFPLWSNFKVHNKEPYVTGTFTLNNKRVGYIRLHTWDDETLPTTIQETINYLLNEIIFLQENTDALVLDQNSNPGGAVVLADTAASFFTDKPRQGMLFQLRPTRAWLNDYEKKYAKEENNWNKLIIKREMNAIRTALELGQELTDPVSLGIDPQGMLRPIKTESGKTVTYTKPVLLLINGESCSGGDAFPAMMQDMGVATLFGERTIGCGGNVEQQDSLGYSDLGVHFTVSMMYRAKEQILPDGSKTRYIENVGVTPDIPYEITEKDFYDNYESYRQAVEKAVLDLIAKTPASS